MSDDWIELSGKSLRVDRAIAFAGDPEAGGIALFLGTTRAESDAGGRTLEALDYAAYEAMAVKQMRDLTARARTHWPLRKCVLLHRTGLVRLTESSVVIVVSSAHRAEAFDACRWLIEQLKASTAIWKQEVWSDGERSWVHPPNPPH